MSKTISSPDPLSVAEWIHLNAGDNVAIQRAGESLRTGRIDDITEDAKIFWVHLDHGRGRILVHEGDKSVVRWLLPTPYSPDCCT
jgi:hypothetical protein